VALAEAVVLTAEDRLDEADAAFGRAQAIFQRYRLPADEADVMHEWGRALGRAGDGPAAADKLDKALDILRRHSAGSPWLRPVIADRNALTRRCRRTHTS
jgi:hypothetical protein